MDSSQKKIRIVYDPSVCIGNGECVKNDPTLFGYNSPAKKAILIGGHADGKKVSVDVSGNENRITYAIRAASSCPVNAFVVSDAHSGKILVGNDIHVHHAKEMIAEYDDAKDFILDPQGYFLIRVDYAKKKLEVGFCNAKNTVVLKVVGDKPIDVYHTIGTQGDLGLRPEHYAYLGRELEKAYHCLMTGLEYVQDDELHSMKPKKKAH